MNTHANLLRRLAPLQEQWTRAAMIDAANEIDFLSGELYETWRTLHAEVCDNTERCASFGGVSQCHCPKPKGAQLQQESIK